MVRHPTARRVHRPKDEPEDQFIAHVFQASTWAQKNARAIIIGGIILVVLAVGTVLYLNSRAARIEAAESELLTVLQTAQTGNPQLAESALEGFLERYGGTPAAGQARVVLAQVYLSQDKAAEAVETLQPAADDLDDPIGPNAALLLGAAYEAIDNHAEAEATYLEVAEEAPLDYQQREALDRAALLRMQQGNPAGAAELYQRLVDMVPETSPERALYQVRLGEAQTLAAS